MRQRGRLPPRCKTQRQGPGQLGSEPSRLRHSIATCPARECARSEKNGCGHASAVSPQLTPLHPLCGENPRASHRPRYDCLSFLVAATRHAAEQNFASRRILSGNTRLHPMCWQRRESSSGSAGGSRRGRFSTLHAAYRHRSLQYSRPRVCGRPQFRHGMGSNSGIVEVSESVTAAATIDCVLRSGRTLTPLVG